MKDPIRDRIVTLLGAGPLTYADLMAEIAGRGGMPRRGVEVALNGLVGERLVLGRVEHQYCLSATGLELFRSLR